MHSDDQEVIFRCLDGQPEAYRHLVERYQAALLAYLTGRVSDRERAEEVTQEAFVRGYLGLGKLNKRASFFPWLVGIANRVMLEQQREHIRREQLAKSLPQPSTRPELSYDLNLERAIAALPDVYREVVLLRYYSQRSCRHVAEQLGIPLGTVTKRLSRAYAMLRETLQRQADQDQRCEV